MLEQLLPLNLPPGLVNNGTMYQTKGRWHAGNLVRFFQGTKQPIGGWSQRTLTGATITGTPRAALSWISTANATWIAVATTAGLYVISSSNVVYDISPAFGNLGDPTIAWQLDLFGTYLLATVGISGQPSVAHIWLGDTAVVAKGLYASGAPNLEAAAITTPERFLTLLGTADSGGLTTSQTVAWASQESYATWVPSAVNSAGDFRLETQGRLVAGRRTRGQTLLWTTVDLWTMTYIGGTLIYSFARAGDNCGIVSPNAGIVLDSGAYWMGFGRFFLFDGFVKPIPCEVNDYVFGSINYSYAYKIWALASPRFTEVTWFYPSGSATEIDRYVTYNYAEDHWNFGTLVRTCGVTQQAGATNPIPVMIGSTGLVYDHETGEARTGSGTVYLESGPIELAAGDRLMRVQRIVPDDKTLGDVQLSLYTSMYPDAVETLNGPYTAANPTSVRLTARQLRLRITETAASAWRVGTVRLGVIPSSRR